MGVHIIVIIHNNIMSELEFLLYRFEKVEYGGWTWIPCCEHPLYAELDYFDENLQDVGSHYTMLRDGRTLFGDLMDDDGRIQSLFAVQLDDLLKQVSS